MPFWSDGNKENFKAKLEHKMRVAKEAPDPTFDISDCNLSEVPSGIYSMCRVFRKEALFLQNNQLTSFQNGGSFKDLNELLVLNAQNNKISYLPDDVNYLLQLLEFNLENNRLKKLPLSFEKLQNLRHLNLKSNNLQAFPLPLCSLYKLEFLDVCNNPKIKTLPKELCNLTMLKTLNLDAQRFTYPDCDTCLKGVEDIMKFLCREAGKLYSPVSDHSSDISEGDSSYKPVESSHLSASYLQYQRAKEQRQQELLIMEEALKENFKLGDDASERKKQLLDDLAQDQERMENEILLLQQKKDHEKQNLLSDLSNVANHSAELVDKLMKLNDRRKKLENMAATLEKDRIDNEEMFTIKQEELEQLRKKEILEAMTKMLQNEKLIKYDSVKSRMVEELQNDENESKSKLFSIFQERDIDKQILVNKLLEEEKLQKEAFEVLHQKKDLQHQEIAHQIHLIEKELSNLTVAEMKKRDLKVDSGVNVLADHRISLANLLTELLLAKEQREKELKERLHQMELKHDHEMEDFWFMQYQKLLDKKPKGIIEAELGLDPDVKNILLDVPAIDLIPLFASKGIMLNDLLTFTVKDLKKVGILDENTCEVILQKAHDYQERISKDYSLPKFPDTPEPSAPPELSSPENEGPSESSIRSPSAPPLSPDDDPKLWCQTECVICMDMQTSAVFLPCGHVCCCRNCSSQVELCPMCRTTISSKFILSVS